MENFFPEADETESKNASDSCNSEACSSSCCSSEGIKLLWLENVKPDGSLFYIECDANIDPFLEDSLKHSYPLDTWSDMRQSKSKLNPAEKIKRWMRDRKKRVRKSFPLLNSNKGETNFSSSQLIDKSSHMQSKDIFIDVDTSKLTFNSKLSLAEMLLGLKFGLLEENYSSSDKPCVIGILQSEEMHDVKIGDQLLSLNDVDVNLSNIEDVLKGIPIPSKVKLHIMFSSCQDNAHSDFQPSRHNDLLKELSDSSTIKSAKLQYQHVQHGLFYISVEKDDVLYCYPTENILFDLKGMFVALSGMISDVASPPLLSCSTVIHGQIIHAAFLKEDDYIMIFALPASVASISEVQHFSTGVAKLLKFQFSSLKQAFTVGNDESSLDKLLNVYFKHYLSSSRPSQSISSEPHLLDVLFCAHWLPLPTEIKTEIDDILSELESSDFGKNSDGFHESRRIYNIFGSCLFYKGYLLCSHLPEEDLIDIHMFLNYYRILELTHTQPISQIIIWKEVFPARHKKAPINTDPEFEEACGRWFMLIVAMQHCTLAVLLDDCGCALTVEGHRPPEPFYVEEAQNTLFILQDCGITAVTEKILNSWASPVISPDLFFKNNSFENSLVSAFASNVSIHSSGPNMNSDHSTSHSSLIAEKEDLADGKSDSDSSFSNYSNETSSFEKRLRRYSISTGSTSKSHASSECSQVDKDLEDEFSKQSSSSLPNLSGIENSEYVNFENSFRMMTSFRNNLFYYLHMDHIEGIFIAPIVPNPSSLGSIQKNILDNFYRSCLNMRAIFERSMRNGDLTKANVKTKLGVNTFLQNAVEQGVLFHHNQLNSTKQKASHHPAHFWVIGKCFFAPEPREVYVCHDDSTTQDIVEMAFRLGFGLSF